jgi:hypothetical protein
VLSIRKAIISLLPTGLRFVAVTIWG